jgi:phosphomannomutase
MDKIVFGTDGWRAIIAKEYTTLNVNRVSRAVSEFILDKKLPRRIVMGYDNRFGGKMFLREAAAVFIAHEIEVLYAELPITTPILSMAAKKYDAALGVVITASHNPPEYNGYKLKGNFGGPLLPNDIEDIQARINLPCELNGSELLSEQFRAIDMQSDYVEAVKANFDIDAIQKSHFRFAFDAMYGSGFYTMKELMPHIPMLHAEWNPLFGGSAPEPILRNLLPFASFIQTNKNIDCGLAVDGDADRIALFDNNGNFIDSHHIILLLIHYLVKYKGMKGRVITAFSVTRKIEKICAHYGLTLITTPVGFKHIAGYFLEGDVLLGGEESGGIAVAGHIPERDGIWMGLILWEFMAKSGKTLQELIAEVYEITGPMAYERLDLHLTMDQQKKAMEIMNSEPNFIGGEKVLGVSRIDGIKFLFENDAWLLVRASGTEPVLRIYAETHSKQKTAEFIAKVKSDLLPS